MRRCTLPKDAPELTGKCGGKGDLPASGRVTDSANGSAFGAYSGDDDVETNAINGANGGVDDTQSQANAGANSGAGDTGSRTNPAINDGAGDVSAHVTPAVLAQKRNNSNVLDGINATVPPTDGVSGGIVPPRLLDENLAVVGAMLHDIGTYLVLKHDGSDGEKLQFDGPNYILHGLRGYDWLLSQGVDESIAQFARNHTGVGLTRDQVVAQGLPLPPADYVPMNLEQEVVMVADKYNSKSIPPRFLTAEAYARKARRFGSDNERQWLDLVKKYGVPDIPALAKKFDMKLDE
ncbi:MAG: HD domain-containing protein [Bifidobacterium sp.]|nr:HD domain-containing protein [Bifidobacterium sp.]